MNIAEVLRKLAGDRRIDEYVVHQRRRRGTSVRDQRQRFTDASAVATIYRDLREGRGESRIALTDDLASLLDDAVNRTQQSVGPMWSLPPPGAPARVQLADQAIAASPDDVALTLSAALVRKGGSRLLHHAIVAIASVDHVETSSGFGGEFASTTISVRAHFGDGKNTTLATVDARRVQDVDIDAMCHNESATLAALAGAKIPPVDRVDLVLTAPALVGDDCASLGMFAPFAYHGDATRHRHGLTRYRLGGSVFGEFSHRGDSVSLKSDGTIDFGWLSRPFDDFGGATRRFSLVRSGIASGLATTVKEAGLGGVEPNGGVGNLVLTPGKASNADLLAATSRPLLRIDKLAWMDVEPRTGNISAEIAFGQLDAAPIRNGRLRGNLFEWFARSRFSAAETNRAWYYGPALIRVDDVMLLS